jgi:hypothetical protein
MGPALALLHYPLHTVSKILTVNRHHTSWQDDNRRHRYIGYRPILYEKVFLPFSRVGHPRGTFALRMDIKRHHRYELAVVRTTIAVFHTMSTAKVISAYILLLIATQLPHLTFARPVVRNIQSTHGKWCDCILTNVNKSVSLDRILYWLLFIFYRRVWSIA